jgi:hypothetical protein
MDFFWYSMVVLIVVLIVVLGILLKYAPREEEIAYRPIFTKEQATRLIALKGCFNELEERIAPNTSGAEYDSPC